MLLWVVLGWLAPAAWGAGAFTYVQVAAPKATPPYRQDDDLAPVRLLGRWRHRHNGCERDRLPAHRADELPGTWRRPRVQVEISGSERGPGVEGTEAGFAQGIHAFAFRPRLPTLNLSSHRPKVKAVGESPRVPNVLGPLAGRECSCMSHGLPGCASRQIPSDSLETVAKLPKALERAAARRLRVDVGSYRMLEAGPAWPSFETWARMCDVFGWPRSFSHRAGK